jgi:hypothetical protein
VKKEEGECGGVKISLLSLFSLFSSTSTTCRGCVSECARPHLRLVDEEMEAFLIQLTSSCHSPSHAPTMETRVVVQRELWRCTHEGCRSVCLLIATRLRACVLMFKTLSFIKSAASLRSSAQRNSRCHHQFYSSVL